MSHPGPTSVESAPHYRWGVGCDGWHLVQAAGLSVIQERMPPATSEARHRHSVARQFFYVLEGELELELAGVRHRLGPRTGLEVPPTTPHQAVNRSGAEVQFLVISQPPSHGDRLPAEPLDGMAAG